MHALGILNIVDYYWPFKACLGICSKLHKCPGLDLQKSISFTSLTKLINQKLPHFCWWFVSSLLVVYVIHQSADKLHIIINSSYFHYYCSYYSSRSNQLIRWSTKLDFHIAKTILNQYKINWGCNAIQCNTMHLSYNASLFPLFPEVYIWLGLKVILHPWPLQGKLLPALLKFSVQQWFRILGRTGSR